MVEAISPNRSPSVVLLLVEVAIDWSFREQQQGKASSDAIPHPDFADDLVVLSNTA